MTSCTKKHGTTQGQEAQEGRDEVSFILFHSCQLTPSILDRRDDQDVYKSAARWISRGIDLYKDLQDVFRISMRIQYGGQATLDTDSDDNADSGGSTEDLHV